ncbi:putative bifunctional diguanylate cyclase/phosphodiesterase [Variovorax fucosicus]|uniref:putative bifunctional diguanylate cyclase/phosphodiesterase n=1 Tax=Variovorax fucosicus TaxID=3053517 RepID=UPI002577A30F|nr:EAL domain-containing protein [Variovorax sp. J22G47]MDM0056301.1 EAL domain-containing protein [Variovorax sp. J22G47]
MPAATSAISHSRAPPAWRHVAWLPRSLRAQFALALSVLSLLMLAGGLAAAHALRTASHATQQLTQERFVRMQDAQDMVERTLLIEREAERLLSTDSLPAVHLSYAALVDQTAVLDRVVAELAVAKEDVGVLELYQASQLFRNTANVVAQLRENLLQTEQAFARLPADLGGDPASAPTVDSQSKTLLLYRLQNAASTAAVESIRTEFARASPVLPVRPGTDQRDPFALRLALINQRVALGRFHGQLSNQAEEMVAAARTRAEFFDGDYRAAVQQLVEASRREARWVLILLAISLVFAWLVAGVFLGQHVLGRLRLVSRHLQQRGTAGTPLGVLVRGRDEIGDMARAVDRFLADRAQLELRTAELFLTKEHLVEQGRVLEMIAGGAPLPDILDRLTRSIESQLEGIKGSILLLDPDGLHLHNGAGPNLPAAYMDAIEGVRIGPSVGSCGTAAYRAEAVITTDIQTDPLWAEYRELAASHGLRSCWSAPILSQEGAVLGTFAMYSGAVRAQSPGEQKLVELATRIAGIAIERRRSEERIRHMAHHDELTGLPNRLLLNDRMAQALAQADRSGCPMALLFLDLDGFKFINDSFGHAAGDAVLVAVAGRMSDAIGAGDIVARLGGDEFVMVLTGLERAADAARVAQRILAALAPPVQFESRSLHIGASIGISVYPENGTNSEILLKHADLALYCAKQQGRNGYRYYTDDMGQQARQHTELRSALVGALPGRQFELHYQPQVDLRTGRINSMEALIRWRHPDLGMVSPARFIPLAEETGLIVPIGEWVLRTACAQLKAWHQEGHAGLPVAVNLSAHQFRGHDVAQLVARILRECDLPARFLELELTESALMLDTGTVLKSLLALKGMGTRLALDDFGTGYSSLSHLNGFPIDVIKIDKSFTLEVTRSKSTAAITRAIIVMAKALGMKTVAEGVETEDQLRFMAAHQCDSMQGYYYSRPLSVADMGALLAENRRIPLDLIGPDAAVDEESAQAI